MSTSAIRWPNIEDACVSLGMLTNLRAGADRPDELRLTGAFFQEVGEEPYAVLGYGCESTLDGYSKRDGHDYYATFADFRRFSPEDASFEVARYAAEKIGLNPDDSQPVRAAAAREMRVALARNTETPDWVLAWAGVSADEVERYRKAEPVDAEARVRRRVADSQAEPVRREEPAAESVDAQPIPKKRKAAEKATKPEREPVVVSPYVPPASDPVFVFRGRKVRPAGEWSDFPDSFGIFAGVPNGEYHAGEGLSSSQLKKFAKSPAHYLVVEKKESDAFELGSACHAVICEGRTLTEAGYKKEPEGLNRRTNEGKEIVAAHESAGWTLLTDEQWGKVSAVALAMGMTKDAAPIFMPGIAELSIRVTDPATSLVLRARFDRSPEEGDILPDLKTCNDATPEGFGKAADNFGYLLQAAHYLHVARLAGLPYSVFRFVAVCTEAPHEVGVYDFGPEHPLWEPVYGELLELYARFKSCRDSGDFPKRSWSQSISVPRWSAYRRERTDEIPY